MQAHSPKFHELFEEIRVRSGLSYDQLAGRAWTSPAYLHRLKQGMAKPSRDFVIRLCLALSLAVDEADELIASANHLALLEAERTARPNDTGAGLPGGQYARQ
jgi:transcriptional regulator with XRE-family HTH domain